MSEIKPKPKDKKNLNWKIQLLKAKIGKNPKVSKAKLIAKIPEKTTGEARPKYFEMEEELNQLETEQKCYQLSKQIKVIQNEIKKAQLATCKNIHDKLKQLKEESDSNEKQVLNNEILLIKGIKLESLSKKILSRIIHKLDLLKDYPFIQPFHLDDFDQFNVFQPNLVDNNDKLILDKVEKKILNFKALTTKINQIKSDVFKIVTNQILKVSKKSNSKATTKDTSKESSQPQISKSDQTTNPIESTDERTQDDEQNVQNEEQSVQNDEQNVQNEGQNVQNEKQNVQNEEQNVEDEAPAKKRKTEPIKKISEKPKPKQPTKSKAVESIFMDSLNDDESDDKAFKEIYGIKPKNRPGQRARRQKMEKLYGEEANHVKHQKQLEADEKQRKEKLRKQHLISKGKNPDKKPVGAKPAETVPENLHPSWIAKQKQKALLANAFKTGDKSNKIKFDD